MREAKDITWLRIASALALQSTCLRRAVGCVLIDSHGEVDGTGWNGVAHGEPHCNETKRVDIDYEIVSLNRISYPFACAGAEAASGTNLDGCEALHAEQNALLQCTDKWSITTCYCVASPCMTCTKLLLNTSCRRIVYIEEYPHAAARNLWTLSGREWIKKEIPV